MRRTRCPHPYRDEVGRGGGGREGQVGCDVHAANIRIVMRLTEEEEEEEEEERDR